MAAHRSDNNFFHLFLFELTQRIVLRLKRFDKCVAVTAKRFPDDLLYSHVHEVIRNLEAFFFECLNDEPPINQVFYCELAEFRQFVR